MAHKISSGAIPAPLEFEYGQQAALARLPRTLFVTLIIFLGVFAVLQGLYGAAADGPVERFFVETLGTRPATRLVNLLTPAVGASSIGSRIVSPGGGINIQAGCEGSETLFLLVAAFCAVLMPWAARIKGLLLGALLVIVLNQCRILTLFYVYRADRELFSLLHTVVAPIVLVVLVGLFFNTWINRVRQDG